jgi:hypothetical protein
VFMTLLALWPYAAHAGAWTQPEDGIQVIVGATYSRATSGFDHRGSDRLPIRYEKVLTQLHAEYGWNDWLTLILAPEYAHARLIAPGRKPIYADDTAIESGIRVRLLNRFRAAHGEDGRCLRYDGFRRWRAGPAAGVAISLRHQLHALPSAGIP